MNIENAIEHALNGNSIVFLGSGYSSGAIGQNNKELVTARVLAKELSSTVDPDDETDDLMIAAANYKREFGASVLISELIERFSVIKTFPVHDNISMIPWKFIFTTNYDDTLIKSYAKTDKKISIFDLDSNISDIKWNNLSCLHINGFIGNLNSSSLDGKFKLTNRSYLTEIFHDSEWSFFFRKELERAKSVFFIGYSLYDLDVARIIFNIDGMKDKTFFIQRKEGYKQSKHAYLENFGNLELIGIDGLWDKVRNIKSKFVPEEEDFEYFSLLKFSPELKKNPASDSDVWSYLMRGDFNADHIYTSIAEGNDYYTVRRECQKIFDLSISGKKIVFLASELGNGKTQILYGVAAKLHRQGEDVYFFDDNFYRIDQADIERLKKVNIRTYIFIDNYTKLFDDIKSILSLNNDYIVIVAGARSVLHEIKLQENEGDLGGVSYGEVYADYMDVKSIEHLVEKFDLYKIWGAKDAWSKERKSKYISRECQSEFSSVLLDLLKSPHVYDKYKPFFDIFGRSNEVADIFVTACALVIRGFDRPSKTIISELLNSNFVFSNKFNEDTDVLQITRVDGGNVIPRSSVLAKFALSRFTSPERVIETLIKITERAHDLGEGNNADAKFYHGIYRDFVTFSFLQPMLPEKRIREALIKFYERIKNKSSAKNHPHFWMQYAIARLSLNTKDDTLKAKLYLDSAYAQAEKRNGYHTKHMDNVNARFYVQMARFSDNVLDMMENVVKAREILHKEMLSERSDAPFKVVTAMCTLYLSKKTDLNNSYQLLFKSTFELAEEKIKSLSVGLKSKKAITECLKELNLVK